MENLGADKELRKTKHQVILTELQLLNNLILQLEGLVERTTGGSITAIIDEPDLSKQQETPSLAVFLTDTPSKISNMKDRVEKALTHINELLF